MAEITWSGGIDPTSLETALESTRLAEQVRQLLDEFSIDLRGRVDEDERANVRAFWDPESRRITCVIGPLGDPVDRYYVLLHELGHAVHGHVGNTQDRDFTLTIEREAWKWAIATAEIPPNDRACAGMVQDLMTYLRRPTPFFDPAFDREQRRATAEAEEWFAPRLTERWGSPNHPRGSTGGRPRP